MRKILLLILVFSLNAFAQNQPGYYITKDKKTVKGYFKTADFTNSDLLMFSETEDGKPEKLATDRISEYGIDGQYRLVKTTVNIDRSTTNYTTARTNTIADWVEQTVFLNVIVQGKASLYSYDSEWGTKYFYSVNGERPAQLLYRVYKLTDGRKAESFEFRSQLYANLKCDGQLVSDFLNVKYNRDELTAVVQNYNKCNNAENLAFENETGHKLTGKYSVFAGVQSTTFSVENSVVKLDKGTDVNFSIGAEASLVMPSKKYEFFVRVEYEKVTGKSSGTIYMPSHRIDIDNELEGGLLNVMIGPRFSFINTDKHNFFGDVAFGLSNGLGDITETYVATTNGGTKGAEVKTVYDLGSTFSINAGVGYMFAGKYGAVLRYEIPRNFDFDQEASYKSKVGRIGLNLIYRIN